MTAAQRSTWPSSRALAGWWPHLDRFRPRSLWLYSLLLHRVEALVGVAHPGPPERLNRLLLEALAPAAAPPATLARRLHLDAQVLGRLLAELEAAGLVARSAGGGAWEVTAAGREVLEGRRELHTLLERRTFYFAEGPPSHPGAHFLPLDRPPAAPWPRTNGWHFDVGRLRACVEQPAEWKQRHGFPRDVTSIAGGERTEPGAWRQVVLDRPEQLLVLFVLGGGEGEEALVGLAVPPDSGQLQADRPVLALGPGWRDVLPELAEEPAPEQWREAWRAWGEEHGLPPEELDACRLEHSGVYLRIQAPQPLAERLRASHAEVLGGETWLLAGAGRLRGAALVQLGGD